MGLTPAISLLLMLTALSGCWAGVVVPAGYKEITRDGPHIKDKDSGLLRGGLDTAGARETFPTPVFTGDATSTGKQGEQEAHSKEPRETKIVGGRKTRPNEQPYLVLVNTIEGDRPRLWCGASLLDEWHVLSAAHCFQFPGRRFTITAGEHSIRTAEDSEQHRTVEKIYNHPDYDRQYHRCG